MCVAKICDDACWQEGHCTGVCRQYVSVTPEQALAALRAKAGATTNPAVRAGLEAWLDEYDNILALAGGG